MWDKIGDFCNWKFMVPGVLLLLLSTGIYFAGYHWPWGWCAGGVIVAIGFLLNGNDE